MIYSHISKCYLSFINRVFHKHTQIGNVVIVANYVFPHNDSFFLYLHHIMSVNVKLDISDHKRIVFQGTLLWSRSFVMTQQNDIGNIVFLYCGEFVKTQLLIVLNNI